MKFRARELVVWGGVRHDAGDVWNEMDAELMQVWLRLASAPAPMVETVEDGPTAEAVAPPPAATETEDAEAEPAHRQSSRSRRSRSSRSSRRRR